MSTLNDAAVMGNFARSCVEIYQNWQADTPALHEHRIQSLLREAARAASLPDFAVSFLDMGDRGGELRAGNWLLAINSRHTQKHELPKYLFKWLCGILYHEARHGEQWVRCAQGVLAGDFVLPGAADTRIETVANAMGLPTNVVWHAEATQRRYDDLRRGQLVKMRGWFDSVYGAQRGHRASVLGKPNIMVTGHAENHDYINLPEEVDAYATQYALEAILDPLLTATVQKAVAASPTVANLRSGHDSAAAGGAKTLAERLQDQAKGLQRTGLRSEQQQKVQQLGSQHNQHMQESSAARTSTPPNLALGKSVKDLAASHRAAATASGVVASSTPSPAEQRSRDRVRSLAGLYEKK